MRKHPKLDSNHSSIVDALRMTGHSVVSLASVGSGCPDLLIGRNGINVILEVKDGSKPPSQRRLTIDELQFFALWKGQAAVAYDVQSALDAVNLALK